MSMFKTNQLWAAILAVEGIGRKSLKRILKITKKHGVSLEDFWQQKPAQIWQVCKLTGEQQAALRKFQKRFTPEDYYGWLRKQGIEIVTSEDKNYPQYLQNIDDKPFVLYTKGDLSGVNQRPIAVVGTRQVSGYGRRVIERIVPGLVAQRASIISGFMYGVDTLAHKQAVKHGGYTVGVLGFGFNYMYPASNYKFFQEMLDHGNCFITEYAPWVGSHAGHFPERNRIVAGMSLATVVIEAAEKSGSHITAGYAVNYGRGVCAVPGSIDNPYSEGTKWLINEGARLVSSAKEILDEAGVFGSGWSKFVPEPQVQQQLSFADTLQEKIYQFLLNGPGTTDELAQQFSLSIARLNPSLSMLELDGYLEKRNDTWFAKTANSVQCLT